MSKNAPLPQAPRTLVGLGPPEPPPGDEPGTRDIPETLRPWALPEDARDASGGETSEISVSSAPAIAAWLSPQRAATLDVVLPSREPPRGTSAARVTPLVIALVVVALLGSGTLGLVLGRGPLSPHPGATTRDLREGTSRVVGNAGCVSPSTPALPPGTESSPTAGTETELPEATTEPRSSRARRHRGRSASASAAPATVLVTDRARIQSIAEAVHLDDGASGQEDAAPDAGR